MIRIRIVTAEHVDQDVEAHLALLETVPRVRLFASLAPLENRLALIAREAVRLRRSDDEVDVMLTVGESALVAAMLAWRGPLVHLPTGPMSAVERQLIRYRDAQSVRVVVSSHLAASSAVALGVPPDIIRVIRTAPPTCHADRSEIREKIGIPQEATCVLLAGRVRKRGGHKMALWAAGILAFRDPTWRFLIDPGQQADYIRRYCRNTDILGSVVFCDQCSASELAEAADVVMVDPDALPAYVAIASAAAHRLPIVASRAMWQREQLSSIGATTVWPARARQLAKGVLEAIDDRNDVALDHAAELFAANHRNDALTRQWLEVLQSVSGRRRAALA